MPASGHLVIGDESIFVYGKQIKKNQVYAFPIPLSSQASRGKTENSTGFHKNGQ
jgi:hypothetical protein